MEAEAAGEGSAAAGPTARANTTPHDEGFHAGTTSINAADASGWVVSVTPSGRWIPAVIAGSTGSGSSQRMQSFVLDRTTNPFNVLEPGKRPRVTLTPTIALKNGKPVPVVFGAGRRFAEQNLLQFLLNVVEFGMNVQQAARRRTSRVFKCIRPSTITARSPEDRGAFRRAAVGAGGAGRRWVQGRAARPHVGSQSPAIFIDQERGTLQGAAVRPTGEDYGIAW
jgi:gamma-glutamyltranspeptidase/glutathione hydrolase